ncbi:MAG: chitobiase/beta-hexosaminidase C-terminal domain-containing protein, partial [Planctomycetales bacterium]|nr:chitobiase/beta-hexosaminidase C-terminal domain-containing protein [Planctomycetales bacterium]
DGHTLAPGGYLIVFASGRDVQDEAGNLHTNFRLNRDGDYLALVDSTGVVVSEFGANGTKFPQQLTDVSYGLYQTTVATEFIRSDSSAQLFVPTDNSLSSSWTSPEFDAGSWSSVTAGVGYDRTPSQGAPILGGNAILNIDFDDDDSGEQGADNTEAGWTQMTLSDGTLTVNGIQVTISAVGGVPLQDRDRSSPTDNPPSLTFDQIYDDFIYAASQTNGAGLEVHLAGLTPGQEYDVSLWSFDSGSSAPRVSDWTEVSGPEPVAIETSYTFDGTEPPTSDFAATMSAKLTASATGELRIQGVRNGGTSFGVFLNAIQVVAPTLEAAIVTDISAQMGPTDTSALLRIPFPYPADFAPDELHLDVAYDSGFVAYLNGTEIARRNAPADPVLPYDATAQSERTVSAALTTERIDLSSVSSLLAVGDNVLAFQALNSGAGDFDFLLNPQLTAIQYGATTSRYFSQPTPGAENLGETFLGVVADPEFSIKRGFYTEPQSLTIHSDSPGASIIYTLDGSLPTPTHGTRVDAASPQTMPDATVTISTTSYVRALVVQDEYLSTAVETQTYIFLDDVLNQTIEPAVGEPVYPATWQSTAYRADYNMDPDVVATWDDNNPANTDTGIREALLSIPTMSIVMDHDDLWGSRAGIYPRAQSQGTIWQRAGSLEYIDPVSGDQFQVNAGVQMHGGASRDNERTKKHSFRLLFNERFGGPSELNYPLFGDSSLESINTFVLKSFFTDGFPTRTATGRYSPLDSQYMRDTWMRDVRNAMGGLDAHSDYVHLYINGLYWGLYSPTERPDDAFAVAYLGGERDDFD